MSEGAVLQIDDRRILERFQSPRYQGFSGSYTHGAEGDNPFCGDTIELRLRLKNGHIEAAAFEGYACSLCVATTDLLLEQVHGMSTCAALGLTTEDLLELWGGLELGRSRRGCVELPLTVLRRALQETTSQETTSQETTAQETTAQETAFPMRGGQ